MNFYDQLNVPPDNIIDMGINMTGNELDRIPWDTEEVHRIPWNTQLRIHEECAQYPETDEVTRSLILEDIRKRGFHPYIFPIVLDNTGILVDGRCRYGIAQELRLDFPAVYLPPEEDIHEYCLRAQDNRKHLSGSFLAPRRNRLNRVAQAHAAGLSLRDIAGIEGVSATQVRRDLKKAGVRTRRKGKRTKKSDLVCDSCKENPVDDCKACDKLRHPWPKDADGAEFPEAAHSAIAGVPMLRQIRKDCEDLIALAESAAIEPVGLYLDSGSIKHKLEDIIALIKSAGPYYVCGYCAGQKSPEVCKGCKDSGWQPKGQWESSPRRRP